MDQSVGEGLQVLSVTASPVRRLLGGPVVQVVAAMAGLVGSITVAVAAVAVGPLPWNRPQPWWFTLPRSVETSSAWLGVLRSLFFGGLALMTVAWLVVGLGVHGGRWRVRWLWVLTAMWGLPWLLGPVALSTDVYTYLGQGLVAGAGIDPYVNGPASVALPPMLEQRIPSIWIHTPSPYGPLFIGLCVLIAPLAVHHLLYAVILMRLVEAGGLTLAAVSLPRVARRCGGDPATAVWLGLASPLMLATGLLSGHNDALMIGLMVAGLALASIESRFARLAAIALATLAALVKSPAAILVVVLALGWAGCARRVGTYLGRLGAALLTVVAVAAVVSTVTGQGISWLNFRAMVTGLKLIPAFTPVNALATTIQTVAHKVGGDLPTQSTIPVLHDVIDVLAVVFGLLVLWRHRRLGPARTAGLVLAAFVFASPLVWPWYLTWPVILIAATASGRGRLAWIAATVAGVFVTEPDGSPDFLSHGIIVVLGVLILGVLAAAVYTCRYLVLDPQRPAPEHQDTTQPEPTEQVMEPAPLEPAAARTDNERLIPGGRKR